jgi:hypothetical protein
MSNLTILGDTSGSVVLDAPAVSGSTVLTLPTTSGTILTTATTGVVLQTTGTWTPDVRNAGASSTFSQKSGTYVKIGNVCFAWFRCDGGNSGGGGGALTISGLPFASAMGFSNASGGMWGTNSLPTNTGNIFFPGNTSEPNLYVGGAQQGGTATFVSGFLTYQVA